MPECNALLIGLLEYIEQVEKLKRKPSYVVPSDIFVAYQGDLKGLPVSNSTFTPRAMTSGYVFLV